MFPILRGEAFAVNNEAEHGVHPDLEWASYALPAALPAALPVHTETNLPSTTKGQPDACAPR
jgi:hypothetical protein